MSDKYSRLESGAEEEAEIRYEAFNSVVPATMPIFDSEEFDQRYAYQDSLLEQMHLGISKRMWRMSNP